MYSTPSAARDAAVYRREKRQARRSRRRFGKDPVQAAPEGPDPGRTLAAIEALPEPVRDAFILARFEEWPHSRIARHLGFATTGAVEGAIAQALYALGQAQEIKDESPYTECAGEAVRAALADFAACRADALRA